MRIIQILIFSILSFSCKKDIAIKLKENNNNLVQQDTTIYISNIPSIKCEYDFSEKEAEDYLYKHFIKKGIKAHSLIKGDLWETGDELFVDFDTIHKIDSEKSMALITYWIAPAYTSGRCLLPYRAIISKNKNGLRITNEEFIPQNFCIDSLIGNLLYVTDFECANNIIKRKYKITLK